MPSIINYQGFLKDAQDLPLSSGNYSIKFCIWDAPTEGDLLWGQVMSVHIVEGRFNALLGSNSGTPLLEARFNRIGDAFSQPNTYIGITLLEFPSETKPEVDVEILPRQQIASTAYAFQAENGVPPGSIIAHAGLNPPNGWLVCNGDTIDSIDYPQLYAAIGETWGDGGDGIGGLFTVPDLRGRVTLGGGHGNGLTPRSIGEYSGVESRVLTEDQMPKHHHHTVIGEANQTNGIGGNDGALGPIHVLHWRRQGDDDAYILSALHGKYFPEVQPDWAPTSEKGGSTPISVVQPYAGVNYIIKY